MLCFVFITDTWGRTRPESKTDKHTGWLFKNENDAPIASSTGKGSFDCEGCVPDIHNGVKVRSSCFIICFLLLVGYELKVALTTHLILSINYRLFTRQNMSHSINQLPPLYTAEHARIVRYRRQQQRCLQRACVVGHQDKDGGEQRIVGDCVYCERSCDLFI
jgi:hypothetical protein